MHKSLGQPESYKPMSNPLNDFPKLEFPEFGSSSKYFSPVRSTTPEFKSQPSSNINLGNYQLRQPHVSGIGFSKMVDCSLILNYPNNQQVSILEFKVIL